MPREKEFTKCIPRIYKRSYEDIGMFFFVEGQKQIIPTITVFQAIKNYHDFIGVEEFDCNTATVTLSRIRAELIDLKYNETTKAHR
jgi:hypothetical protein